MNFIFLDCDGVLNDQNTEHRIQGVIGFDKRKIQRLARIVKATGAQIVLSSSWKFDWRLDKTEQNIYGNYLDAQLAACGLSIIDKTNDEGHSDLRGRGILTWLARYREAYPGEDINYIILDDEDFDFADCNILDRWVRTHFYAKAGGIREAQVKQAIELLGGTYESE